MGHLLACVDLSSRACVSDVGTDKYRPNQYYAFSKGNRVFKDNPAPKALFSSCVYIASLDLIVPVEADKSSVTHRTCQGR